jgi:hypothetical protein
LLYHALTAHCLLVHIVPCHAHWQEVDDLYLRAIKHFKDNAIIRVFAAQYYNIYRNNHRIEQMHLTEADVGVTLCSEGGLHCLATSASHCG